MVNYNGNWGSRDWKVPEANKPFKLINDDIEDAEFVAKADKANTGTIRICADYGVTVGGYTLDAGEFVSLPIKNMNMLYASGSVANDELHILYSGGLGRTNKILVDLLNQLIILNNKIRC